MSPRLRASALSAAALVLALAVSACGSSAEGGAKSGANGVVGTGGVNGASAKAAAVVILQYVSFTPARVTIHAGQTVEWLWKDAPVPHNVTGTGFSSPTQSTGKYFHTFDTPGTFHYRCTIHHNMTGVVVVLP